jgi:cytoskeletal protein CcmA (bactofilin family)
MNEMTMRNHDAVQEAATSASQAVVGATAAPLLIEERRIAWVGKSILFRGDLIGLEDMTIDGRVEGTIALRDRNLTIGSDAYIQGDITAKSVTVHGAVVGTITATDAVRIRHTGSVEGNITSERLALDDGAVVNGRVNTREHRGSR